MMSTTVAADRQVFEQALKAARKAGQNPEKLGLNAPGDATLLGRLDQVWKTIETALQDGYQLGHDVAKTTLDRAIEEAEKLMEDAGKHARELHSLLLQRLQAFVHAFIKGALALVPTALAIGNQDYSVEKFTFTQKVLMTGSIKTNILEVCSLTSNGELSVSVDYAVQHVS